MTDRERSSFSPWTALKNGVRRVCPHCGRGQMLDGWLSTRRSCPACGLVYQRKPGDTWAFWIVGDRIPVAFAIAVVYFGFGPRSWLQGATFVGAIAALLIGTFPHRMGLVIALHYLTRRYWPDPDDPVPGVDRPSGETRCDERAAVPRGRSS